jgi:glycosyltransferase involved in cell wall biosynthesis
VLRRTLLIIAPEPPPYFGAAVATKRLLDAGRRGCFRFRHVNTIDPAGTSNMGKLAPANFVLALKHYLETVRYLISDAAIEAVYLPITFTNAPAFWRDLGFVALAQIFRKQLIMHCHDNRVEEFYRSHWWPARRAVRWSLRAARSIVVLCPRMGVATQRVVASARVEIVPNGVDLEDTVAEAHAAQRASALPIVLFLSQLSEEKGFLTALRVAATMRQRGVAIRFEFAGGWRSPGDELQAQRWVADNGLDSFLRIHGPVSDEQKTRLLKAADIFLFPTSLRHEGQPLVILEAMAAGLPVITTDIGCISDTVIENVTGFVLHPKDVDGMADKLTRLVGNDELRNRLGAAGRARYLAEFTEDSFIQRMTAVLRTAAPSVLSDSPEDQRAAGAYELE